ncbi:unnamed protein product [Prorocentrum cordatum]|uniref:Uncharacterized protein n=1 Tax=Prorocentrum cordatum TaxID=2364126 RepID=A0ABN9UKU5_9DINO|nr:unnamed protein product [Polarella glacialis]
MRTSQPRLSAPQNVGAGRPPASPPSSSCWRSCSRRRPHQAAAAGEAAAGGRRRQRRRRRLQPCRSHRRPHQAAAAGEAAAGGGRRQRGPPASPPSSSCWRSCSRRRTTTARATTAPTVPVPQLAPKRVGRKATGVPTKQQLLASLLQEDDDSDGDDAPGDHAADTHGKRVTIVVPEAAGESGGPQLAPQRKGRKATGVPTKEQLLAKLQQEDDDDSEGDDGSNRAADTHGKRVTIVVSEAASESSVPQLAPKRVDRKATGAPTKQQLLAKLQQEADDDSEGDDAQGDCPGKAPVAPGKRVKMAAPQSAREPGYARPLLDSAGEHSDPARQQNVRFHAEQEARELPTILAAPKRRGRKATGVVTKEQLLDALAASAAAAAADSEEDGAEEATGAARVRCAGRQCTAFVPAAQAEVLDEGVERAIGPSAGWPFCCQ